MRSEKTIEFRRTCEGLSFIVLQKMNTFTHQMVAALSVFILCSCEVTRTDKVDRSSTKNSVSVDGSTGIKDLVSKLPPYSYYEGSIDSAKEWLTSVKIERANLNGRECDSVLYPADGCRGSTRFYLDRSAGKFWERYYAWEPGTCDTITEYNVLNGRLIRVSQKDVSQRIPW